MNTAHRAQLLAAQVCFISHSAKLGGAELVLLETLETLRDSKLTCRVVIPEAGPLCQALTELKVPFTILSCPNWTTQGQITITRQIRVAIGILINTIYLAVLIRRWGCRLVYTNTVTTCAGALAAWLLRIPHVWHLHEFGSEDHGLSYIFGDKFSLDILNRRSQRVICVSKALSKKYLQHVDESKLSVIYPSMHRKNDSYISTQTLFASNDQRFRCVIVGTLSKSKGQDDCIRAVAFLKTMGIDVELVLVGEGPTHFTNLLADLTAACGVTDRVHMTGYLANPIAIVNTANVVLICSACEAFGRVTIEAMLAGKAVIGARAGASYELIEEPNNGLVYSPGDFKDLASKIQLLWQSPELASNFGRKARLWAESIFTPARYRDELQPVVYSLIVSCDPRL